MNKELLKQNFAKMGSGDMADLIKGMIYVVDGKAEHLVKDLAEAFENCEVPSEEDIAYLERLVHERSVLCDIQHELANIQDFKFAGQDSLKALAKQLKAATPNDHLSELQRNALKICDEISEDRPEDAEKLGRLVSENRAGRALFSQECGKHLELVFNKLELSALHLAHEQSDAKIVALIDLL